MRAALSKTEIENGISSRFSSAFKLPEKIPVQVLSSGIAQVDSFTGGGLPRGAITEIFGSASSGRTSFMLSNLAYATSHDEVCALVDTSNAFDPDSATQAGINLERLLWIRCANNLEHAFKATDLLLQGGGFGMVVLDLGDVAAKDAKRIISSWWYRFRRILESTPTVLITIAEESCAKSCASLALELKQAGGQWSANSTKLKASEFAVSSGWPAEGGNRYRGKNSHKLSAVTKPESRELNLIQPPHATLLQGLNYQVECQRPLHQSASRIRVIEARSA